ncbi:uncharacterized protein TRAVEDRAFT_109261 [Trametes versicolor FP-101664 SS1]|uniref:uncharacterized protein n=1 Tax=Trametes versicolor (strain FP-101664) TaxID=717944 RepID=UPI0004622EB2|nr:uncharacterized protein TRAVEDRAFT_109261 [Trametes versicolor FP-101664 SS1]EIW64967.1 hypothetical protein TRAVEDRAFT_109261 [Trametes versicolor FP-101664 SS1]
MSFGRPPSISGGFSNSAPDRGSFPLDHYGECKQYMQSYLDCLRKNTNNSTPCRHLNKDYLECRMARGLMDRDDWSNLGLNGVRGAAESSNSVVKDNPKDKPNV